MEKSNTTKHLLSFNYVNADSSLTINFSIQTTENVEKELLNAFKRDAINNSNGVIDDITNIETYLEMHKIQHSNIEILRNVVEREEKEYNYLPYEKPFEKCSHGIYYFGEQNEFLKQIDQYDNYYFLSNISTYRKQDNERLEHFTIYHANKNNKKQQEHKLMYQLYNPRHTTNEGNFIMKARASIDTKNIVDTKEVVVPLNCNNIDRLFAIAENLDSIQNKEDVTTTIKSLNKKIF